MDPVTLIVAALVAGASAGLTDAASSAVKDAYGALKFMLHRHFSDRGVDIPAPVASTLSALEQHPDADTVELHTALESSGARADQALVRAAIDLLTRADPTGTEAGKYAVTISGGKGIVIGNEGTVTMTFDDHD